MADAPNWKTLFDAVQQGDIDGVKRLVSKGLAVTSVNKKHETAAHIAAKTSNLAILEYLLAEDKSLLSVKDEAGQNVLHVAAMKGATDIVKYLVDSCHVEVFLPENFLGDNSAVHLAAREGHMDLLEYFLWEKQVDVDVRNDNGLPLTFVAASNKQLPTITYLVDTYGANLELVDYENRNILFQAALHNDVTVATYVLDKKKVKLDVNWADKGWRSVVHWCAIENHQKIAKYFVEVKRAELNQGDLMRQTPLHLAAQAGHVKMVEYLYEKGADPEMPDIYGKMPKEYAKDKRVIQFLTDHPKMRQRLSRSVTLPSLPSMPHRYSYAINQPIPYRWMRDISGNLFRTRGYLGDGSVKVRGTVRSPEFDSFLTLATVLIGIKQPVNEDLSLRSSPLGDAKSRVDPVAMGMIQSILDDVF